MPPKPAAPASQQARSRLPPLQWRRRVGGTAGGTDDGAGERSDKTD